MGVQGYVKSLFFEKRVIAELDKAFSIESFKQEATRALITISEFLASDDITPLKENGLVEEKTYWAIKAYHDRMSPVQRRKLFAVRKHIFAKFIHEARIIQDDKTGEKAVEIYILFGVAG